MGQSLDELIRARKNSKRPEPYSLYSAEFRSKDRRSQPQQRSGGRELDGMTLVAHVKSYNPRTGWGFLDYEAVPRDIFLHRSQFDVAVGDPDAGDLLQFQLSYTPDGDPKATLVRLASERRPRPWVQLQQGATSQTPPLLPAPPPPPVRLVPRQPSDKGKDDYENGSGNSTPGTRIRIMNIPWTLTWQKVRDAFEVLGEVQFVRLDEDKVGQAVVAFQSASVAQTAVEEFNKGSLNGREIYVRLEA